MTAKAPDLTAVNADGELDVNLHAGQWKAWQSKARHVLVLAGTQSGKTSFGPLWLYREIQLRGPGDYLVVAPSFPLLELKLRPEFMRLFDLQLRLGAYVGSPTKKFVFSESGSMKTFGDRYDPDVVTTVFFGHAKDPDALESATAKAAWLDEAGQKKFKKASHEAIMRRLAIHRGRVLYTTTPYYIGWLKKEFADKADGVYIEVINFASTMNPAFSLAEYEEQKSKLPPWKFDMFYDGKFTRPAGLIYDVYDYEIHTVEPFAIPKHWPRVFGFDFGGVNTACLKFALNPARQEWFCYGEYLGGGRTAKEHREYIMAGEDNPWAIRAVGGAPSESDYRREYKAAGLPIEQPPLSDVEVGILKAYALLKTRKVFFFRTLSGVLGDDETTGEIESYSRVLNEAGEPTDVIEDKAKFHRLDCFRYAATLMGAGLPLTPVTMNTNR